MQVHETETANTRFASKMGSSSRFTLKSVAFLFNLCIFKLQHCLSDRDVMSEGKVVWEQFWTQECSGPSSTISSHMTLVTSSKLPNLHPWQAMDGQASSEVPSYKFHPEFFNFLLHTYIYFLISSYIIIHILVNIKNCIIGNRVSKVKTNYLVFS